MSSIGQAAKPVVADVLGLYLHIPFCPSICNYCNFNRGLFDPELKPRYVRALEREIRSDRQPGPAHAPRAADTIFFGGGTPSLLEPEEVAGLIRACRESFDLAADAEITLETNPETVTAARLAGFRAAGVNRISFGVQSLDDAELVRLSRAHDAARAREAVRDARAAGFANLSFDLMLWLPGQSFSSWLRTVDEAVHLAPDHLSLYLLELYPNAPLKEAMARAPWAQAHDQAAWAQVSDDEAADMYLAGLERLDAAGFAQYEVSNVAKDGFRSRHNLKYWQSGSWRGFGCGAHSTVDGWRWRNVSATDDYIRRVDDVDVERGATVDLTELSRQSRFEETLFTGLRLNEGIDRDAVTARFGIDPWDRYREALTPFLEVNLLWQQGRRFGLTRHGMLVANDVLATFV